MVQRISTREKFKEGAIRYFDEHSKLWADRYSDPGCGQQLWERHSAILDVIDGWRLSESSQFLDIGCGRGLLTFDLARRGLRGAGIDGAASMIESCKAEAERAGISGRWIYTQADVERIPFAGQSFDAAVCCGVIEYLPDDAGLLREVRRILRPGGRFLLCVTNRYSYSGSLYPLFQRMKRIPGMIQLATSIRERSTGSRSEMMNLPNEPRRHSPSEIRRALMANGFQVEEDKFVGFTLLPGPFSVLFSKLEGAAAAKITRLNETSFRDFGSFYLVSSKLER